jgi:hypothetical protein
MKLKSKAPTHRRAEKKIIVDTLKEDYDLQGERLEILKEAAERVHEADTTVEAGEILGEITGWIVEDTALAVCVAAAGTALQLVSAALTPIIIAVRILNANDTDKRLAGMQAIGYALIAWAFDDPIPAFPSSLRRNLNAAMGPAEYGLQPVEPALKEASDATVRNLEAKVLKRGRSKVSYQLFWPGIAEGDRKKLVRMLMDTGAAELGGVERMSFLRLDPDRYPN